MYVLDAMELNEVVVVVVMDDVDGGVVMDYDDDDDEDDVEVIAIETGNDVVFCVRKMIDCK